MVTWSNFSLRMRAASKPAILPPIITARVFLVVVVMVSSPPEMCVCRSLCSTIAARSSGGFVTPGNATAFLRLPGSMHGTQDGGNIGGTGQIRCPHRNGFTFFAVTAADENHGCLTIP